MKNAIMGNGECGCDDGWPGTRCAQSGLLRPSRKTGQFSTHGWPRRATPAKWDGHFLDGWPSVATRLYASRFLPRAKRKIPIDKQGLTSLVCLRPFRSSLTTRNLSKFGPPQRIGENNVENVDEIKLNHALPDGLERCRKRPVKPDGQSRKCPSRNPTS